MSKGQALPFREQPQDVAADPVPTAAMGQTSFLPSLSSSTLTNLANTSNDVAHSVSSSYNISENLVSDTYLQRHQDSFGADVTWQGSTTEDYLKAEEEFYSSYNPQIGLHTAAVLGGILGWLVVYLLYKTKVKKFIVKFVTKKYNQRKNRRKNASVCEVPSDRGNYDIVPPAPIKDNFLCHNHNQHPHKQLFQQPFSAQEQFSHGLPQLQGDLNQTLPYTLCEDGSNWQDNYMVKQCPMPSIVVESYSSLPAKTSKKVKHKHKRARQSAERKESTDRDPEQGGENPHTGHKAKRKGRHTRNNKGEKNKKFDRKRSRSYTQKCPEVTVLDVDELDTKSLLLPPCSETDATQATARWIQNMPLLVQSYQDITGLILKIEPDLVNQHKPQSCPMISAALQYAALPLLGLPDVSHLNKSMPLLRENGPGGHKDNELDSIFSDEMDNLKYDNHVARLSPVLQPQKVHHHHHQHSLSDVSAPPPPRPHTSLSYTHSTPSPQPTLSRPPPPKLTISIPDQTQFASSTNLSVPSPSPNPFLNPSAAMSAPASPVPIPVTPTVTIQNFTSRVSRSMPLHGRDSEDSVSTNSSIDPLLHAQEHGKPLSHSYKSPPSPSWIVFDDDLTGLSVGHSPQCPSNGSSGRTLTLESPCQNNATPRTSDAPDTGLTLETRL